MTARRWLAHPRLLERHPYYAAVLARTRALMDPSVRRIAVAYNDGRHYLIIGAEELEAERELGLLMHAVHHVVLGHLTHPRLASPAHPELMRLAMEISANEHVPYPIDGARWQDFEDRADLRPRQSTAERYARLCEARRAGRLGDAELPEPTCDAPDVSGGRGSSEPDDTSLRATRELVREALDSLVIPPHGEAALLAGQDPGDLLELLEDVRRPNTPLDWREAMRRFAALVRAPVHTWSRPSRRFPNRVGELPGRTWAVAHGAGIRPRVLCAIDTSGSLAHDELLEIAAQLRELGAFAEITVVECDVKVQRVYRFDGKLDAVRGRGGTDLRPPFAREVLGAYRPDGVVYFTDGLGPFPGRDPGVPTLWVLTKPVDFRCPWGARAHVRPA